MRDVAGSSGCLVDPLSVDEIRQAIRRIASDEQYRQELTTAGFRNATRFSARAVAQAYGDLYQEILARVKDRTAA
jgi:glycosyltransferase involved in cell wall biosynthesis